MLGKEKAIDWELGYAMTIHTRYMNQDKKKGREFNLSVDYILVLKDLQKNKCELCLNEMLWEWDEAGNSDQ
ncbi:70_t:CDS:2, partial [Dentiscutata heterogama]